MSYNYNVIKIVKGIKKEDIRNRNAAFYGIRFTGFVKCRF